MKIETRFTHDQVRFDTTNDIHAVVSLTAPKKDWEKERRPICIVLSIDISASMSGSKLEFAKQSAIKLVDHLRPGDYCGVVAFGDYVHEVSSPQEMSQASKDALKAKIGDLHVSGCTNFAGGMRQALEWINGADLAEKYMLRVIMLTDGHANRGECQGKALLPFMSRLRGDSSVSCFGYGNDCDQKLLADLADEGQGNYAFIRNPDDALTAFGKELGGLLSVYAQELVVDVAPFNGHEILDVLSDVDVEEDGKKIKIKVPEILSEEVRHLVFSLRTSAQTKALPRAMNVLDVKATWRRLDKTETVDQSEELKAKIKFVKAGEEQGEPTREVIEIVGLAKIVQAQIAAEQAADAGDYTQAQAVMDSAVLSLSAFNLDNHVQYAKGLRAKVGSRAVYANSSGVLRSSRSKMTRGAGGASDYEGNDELAKVIGSSMPLQNEVQCSTASAFASGTATGGSTLPSVTSDASSGTLSGTLNSLAVPAEGAEEKSKEKKKKKAKGKKKSRRW